MKATEQYFPVVLFIMLYKVVLTFDSADEILVLTFKLKLLSSTFLGCCSLCRTRWFPGLSLWIKSMFRGHGRNPKKPSNESYRAILSCAADYLLCCTRWS